MTSLDAETEALLEILAENCYNTDTCRYCGTHLPFPQDAFILHTEECPTSCARARLARNGTPAKMWQITCAHQRLDGTNEANGMLRVVLCDLDEDKALKLITDATERRRKRRVIAGSVQFQEIAIVE